MKVGSSERLSVLLITAGIVLAAYALSLPLFKLEFTGYTSLVEGGMYKGEYSCFPDYFAFDDLGYHTGPGYNPWHGGIADYRALMNDERILVGVSVLLSIMCVGALLFDRRRAAAVMSALAAGTAIIAAAHYYLAVDNAISIYLDGLADDLRIPDIPNSFVGSATDESGVIWSWGPSSGWIVLVASAAVLSVAACFQALTLRKESTAAECKETQEHSHTGTTEGSIEGNGELPGPKPT